MSHFLPGKRIIYRWGVWYLFFGTWYSKMS